MKKTRKQMGTDLHISTKYDLAKARAEAEKLFEEYDNSQPTLATSWQQELQIPRQDGVFSYLDKSKKTPHLPIEIMWQIACGKVRVYDPETCLPDLEEETGGPVERVVDTKHRIKAAHVLLEYMYGKPAQDVNVRTENVNHNINYAALSPEKLEELEKMLQAAVELAELPVKQG